MTGDDDAVMPFDQGISRKPRARAGGAAREDPNGLHRQAEGQWWAAPIRGGLAGTGRRVKPMAGKRLSLDAWAASRP